MVIDLEEYGELKGNVKLLMKDRAKVTQLFIDNEDQALKINTLEINQGNLLKKFIGIGATTGLGGGGIIYYLLENFM